MFYTKSLLSLTLVGFMGVATAATTTDIGTLTGTSSVVGNTFLAGATILDTYIFDITTASTVVGAAVAITLNIPLFPGQEFAISNFMVQFQDSVGTTIASDIPANSTDDLLNISVFLPAALDYKFVVSGNVTGTLGGSYGGALAAAPIPEADTYAMMLAGLGLIGFMVSRRGVS